MIVSLIDPETTVTTQSVNHITDVCKDEVTYISLICCRLRKHLQPGSRFVISENKIIELDSWIILNTEVLDDLIYSGSKDKRSAMHC